LWTAVVLIVAVGASILSDLPTHATPAQRAREVATVVRQINTDLHACVFAASQSFTIYRQITAGTFPPGDRALVPRYLSDDQQACSFEDQSIYSVSTITIPNISAGSDLTALVKAVLEWSTSDAVGAIVDIETLVKSPHDARVLRDLAKRERMLASDRALAEHDLRAADRTVGTEPIPNVALPALPHPNTG